MYFPLFGGGGSVFGFVLICIILCHFLLCIHLDEKKKELVALLLLSFQMSCYCKCHVAFPHGAMDWSSVCDCGIS